MTLLVQQPSPARILVGVRVRPYANSDHPAGRVRGQFGHFNYDFVHVSATQDDIFQTLAVPLVHKLVQVNMASRIASAPACTSCHATKLALREHIFNGAGCLLQGKSSVVLLYGASQTGKTYTLEVCTCTFAGSTLRVWWLPHRLPDVQYPSVQCWQGLGALGGHKEGLIPRSLALLLHLIKQQGLDTDVTATQHGEPPPAA